MHAKRQIYTLLLNVLYLLRLQISQAQCVCRQLLFKGAISRYLLSLYKLEKAFFAAIEFQK